MSTNASNFSGRMSSYGLRVWIAILAIAVLIFGANFFVANRLSGQENSARAMTAQLQVLSQQLAKYSRRGGRRR